jgi:DNA-binding IclR family transcriptional regulator
MGGEAKYRAPALEKGLDVIELLSREESGLGVAEMARRLDRTVGEIFRMIVVLEARGYIARVSASDRYALTSLLFELAHRTPLLHRLTAVAQPVMRRLTAEINQSAHLAVLNEDKVLVIEQVPSPGNNHVVVRLGATIDIWRASSGRVIVAFMRAEDRRRIVERFPPPDGTPSAAVEAEFAAIRAAGWEMRESFVVRGVTNISAPIIDRAGQPVAALTVPHVELLHDPLTPDACCQAVATAARSLSASLGGGSLPPARE